MFAPAALYLLLTLAWTWPLPLYLTDRVPHDLGDPLLVTYLLWWNAHVVPLSDAMWSPPMYWPMRDALALTEHGAGMGVVASPIQWLGGSALLAYNVLLILSTWWSGLAAHALVRRLTGSTLAAFCGGIAFAFAPYRASQLSHLHLLVTWWLPLALIALHAYYEDGRARWLALFGVSWLMQSLTNGYYMLFLPVLIGVWLLAYTLPDWRIRVRRAAAVIATWIVCSLPLVPVLLEYYTVQHRLGLSRSRAEMRDYSADWTSFFDTSDMLGLWPPSYRFTPEAVLFPGLTVIVVVIAAAVLARGAFTRTSWRHFIFYMSAALLTAWMCFGPPVEAWSIESLWRAYAWIAWLPGYSGLRVPARFFMLTTLCLAVAVGLAVSALTTRYPRHAVAIGVLVCGGLFADGWIEPMPLPAPPRRFADRLEPGARVLELPIAEERVNIQAIYRSILHGAPTVNGYGGYVPMHVRVIGWALERQDASVLTELRRGRPLYVVVTDGPDAHAWASFMEAQPGVTMIGVSGAGRVYQMPPAAFAPQIEIGPRLNAIGSNVPGMWLQFDLGSMATLAAIELRTEGSMRGVRDTLRVETSEDGQQWAVAADERPGGPAFLGALERPLDVPLRVYLPQPRARYVRINTPAFSPAAVSIFAAR